MNRIANVKSLVMIMILSGFVFLPGFSPVFAQTPGQIGVEIVSPLPDTLWTGKQTVKIELKRAEPGRVKLVEFYLDGRLLKEIKRPPFQFTHDFGELGQNRTIKVLVRGEKKKLLAVDTLKSFQADDSQTVEVRQVTVPVTVKDKDGNYVRGLKKSDFQVFVDNRPVEISYMKSSGTEKFNMAQVIDISYSMRYKIHDVLLAAQDFIKKLMTPNDRCTFVFFNQRVFDHDGFTGDLKELGERLELRSPVSGGTALFDSVAYTLNEMNGIPGWNIMVVFSDGEDNSSYIDRYSLLKKVKKSPVVIFAINNDLKRNDDILGEICSLSGGMVFPLTNVKETAKVYDKIREEIKSQYVLYFTPKSKNQTSFSRFKNLTVKVKNKNKKYTVRTLKGFY